MAVSTATLRMMMEAKDNASGVIGKVSGMIKRLGKTAGLTAAVGLSALGIGTAKLVKEATMAAARVEEMDVVLKVLGKNAGISKKKIDGYVQGVIDAGIETSIAQQVTAQFIRTNLDLEKSTDLARVAQDAAVISQKDSSETLNDMILGITKQNVLILRNAGILIDASTAYETYAEEVGKSVDELTRMDKTQAFLNATIEAGTTVAGAYEAAMETAGKQLRSMPRHMKEFLNAFGKPFLGMFSAAIKKSTEFLKFLREMAEEGEPLNRVADALSRIFSVLFGVSVDTVADDFSDFEGKLDSVAFVLERIADFLENLQVGNFQKALEALGIPEDIARNIIEFPGRVQRAFEQIKFGNFEEALRELGVPEETIASIFKFVDEVKAALDLAWTFIQEFVGNLMSLDFSAALQQLGVPPGLADQIGGFFTDIAKIIIGAGKVIGGAILVIIKVLDNIGKWIKTNWKAILAVFLTAWEVVKATFISIVETITEALAPLTEFLDGFGITWQVIWEDLVAVFVGVLAVIGALFMGLIGIVVGLVQGIIEAFTAFLGWVAVFGEGLANLIGGVIEIFAGVWAMLNAIFTGNFDALQGLWFSFWNGLIDTAKGLAQVAISIFVGFFDIIMKLVGGFIDGVITFFKNLAKNLVGNSIIPDMLDDMLQAFIDWFVDVLKGIGGWVSDMVTAGINLMKGFWEGLKQMMDKIIQDVKNFVNDIIGTIEKALHIKSPSGVLRDIGINMIRGLASGILGEGKRQNIPGMVNDLLNPSSGFGGMALGGAGGGAIGGGGNGMMGGLTVVVEYSPTISTVDDIEAAEVIAPLIEGAVRDIMAEKEEAA